MPSYLDLGVLGVVLVSALLSMMRGFSREILAIGAWAAAAAAAYYFYPQVLPYVSPYIHKDVIAQAVAAAVVFFVTLIVVSLFTVRISDAILDSKIGALDRTLGFVFGAARGFLLAVVAFWIFNWMVAEKQQPEWVQTAKTRPVLRDTATKIIALLPEDAAATIDGWIKSKTAAGANEEPPDESSAPAANKVAPATNVAPAPAPAANKPAPAPAPTTAPAPAQKKVEVPAAGAAATADKQKLDAIINKAVPPPLPPTPAVLPKP